MRIFHYFTFYLLSLSVLTAISCRSDRNDAVLSSFEDCTFDASVLDSISLASFGMYLPVSIAKYGDWFAIQNAQSDKCVQLFNPKDSLIIDCIRKGRGPGEVIMPSSFQLTEGSLFLYDISQQKYCCLNMDSTISKGAPSLTTLVQFNNSSEDINHLERPYVLCNTKYGIVANGIFTAGKWFGRLNDSGSITDGIDYCLTDQMSDWQNQEIAVTHTSTSFAISPDGNHLVAALKNAPILSVCSNSEEKIAEINRIVFGDFLVRRGNREKREPAVVFDAKSRTSFCEIKAADQYFYVLYSGNSFSDNSVPGYECEYILKFSYDSDCVKAYHLPKRINSFDIQNNMIYGVTSFPEPRIYLFSISDM